MKKGLSYGIANETDRTGASRAVMGEPDASGRMIWRTAPEGTECDMDVPYVVRGGQWVRARPGKRGKP